MAVSTPSTMKLSRYHGLDYLRAIMMILGLVLHTSLNYAADLPPNTGWMYRDDQTSVFFKWMVDFIHIFRMPVFFLVAGLFAAYLCYSRGSKEFLRHRWQRIGIPLVIAWIILLPAMYGSSVYAAKMSPMPLPARSDPALVDLGHIFQHILMHLWFLYHLLIFCVSAAAIALLARRLPHRIRTGFLDSIFGRVASQPWGIIVLSAISTATLYPMHTWALDYSGSIFPPLRLLVTYGAFFAFGWFLYLRREILNKLQHRGAAHLGVGLLCFGAYRYFYVIGYQQQAPEIIHAAAIWFLAVTTWSLVYGFVGLFLRHLNSANPSLRYLSDASYWMYLVHPPLTLLVPTLMASVELNVAAKFLLALAGVTAITLVTYHYLVRATFVGKQLNGRRYPLRIAAPVPR